MSIRTRVALTSLELKGANSDAHFSVAHESPEGCTKNTLKIYRGATHHAEMHVKAAGGPYTASEAAAALAEQMRCMADAIDAHDFTHMAVARAPVPWTDHPDFAPSLPHAHCGACGHVFRGRRCPNCGGTARVSV